MRFPIPKLSQFFHRRSKSDSALSRRLEPLHQSTRRPLSASHFEGLAHIEDSRGSLSSEVLSRVPTTPVDLRRRPVSLATVSSAVTANSSCTQISVASHTVIVEVLTRRIQELEASVHLHEVNAGLVASLEADLESSRHALREAGEANAALASTIAGLKSELARLHTDLSDSARCQAQPERREEDTGGTRTSPVPGGGPAKQTDIMVNLLTPGADRSVLDAAYERVLAGEDPEDALVDAIKEAASKPGSTWRRLLEPVVGERSPEDYVAQVNCTLQARRETRGWRHRTAFWKLNAKEGGRHPHTVTPSASQISDVVKDMAEASKGTVDLPKVTSETAVQTDPQELEDNDVTPRPPLAFRLGLPRDILESIEEGQMDPIELNRNLDGSIQSRTQCEVGVDCAAQIPPYISLPPLASITFRESYSIRSIPSKRESLGLSASASASSQNSRASHKRRAIMLDTPSTSHEQHSVPSASVASNTQTTRPHSGGSLPAPASVSSSGSRSSTENTATSSSSGTNSASELTPPPTLSGSNSPSSSGSWELLNSFIAQSLSLFGNNLQDTLAIKTPEKSPESSNSPTRKEASPTSSSHSTPTKKSRLPVPVTSPKARKPAPAVTFMKRLSLAISRPVLVDSTNAAAIGPTSPRISPVKPAATTGDRRLLRRIPETTPTKTKIQVSAKSRKGKADENDVGRRMPWENVNKGRGTSRTRVAKKEAA